MNNVKKYPNATKVRLTDDMKRKLRIVAEYEDVTVAALIRIIIADTLRSPEYAEVISDIEALDND